MLKILNIQANIPFSSVVGGGAAAQHSISGLPIPKDARLTVEPLVGLRDEAISIIVTGVSAGDRVTIRSRLTDDANIEWRAEGTFYADVDGTVDVARNASIDGTYLGVDKSGLFWSMLPAGLRDLPAYLKRIEQDRSIGLLPVFKDLRPIDYEILVFVGGEQVTGASYRMLQVAPGVSFEDVHEEPGVRGVYFEPAGPGPHPGVIIVPGSSGGIQLRAAALLASRGIATFAMALFNYSDLPPTFSGIPLERFSRGLAFMRRRLGHNRIGMRGASKGSEGVLLAGIHFREEVKALVPWVPGFMATNGRALDMRADVPLYTMADEPVPYALPTYPSYTEGRAIFSPQEPLHLTPIFMTSWVNPEDLARHAYQVEKIACPVLCVSGTSDEMWASAIGAERICQRLRAHSHPHEVMHQMNEGAGHSFFLPNEVESLNTMVYHPVAKIWMSTGGMPSLNAKAARDSWAVFISFLHRHLGT
jgi:dienelactone hydrolase